MYKTITKSLTILLLVLLVISKPLTIHASGEKTPPPKSISVTPASIYWEPAELKSDLKFKIYYKDKWSGESYKLVATCKGFDEEYYTPKNTWFYLRDASNEKDPQIKKEKRDGITYYSLPAISGHKYKVAVKVYDEKYGLWSDITAAELYYMSTPKSTIKQTKKGVSISWKPVTGATKYYVERISLPSNLKETEGVSFKIVGNDQTRFLDKDVIEGMRYQYRIVAGRGKWLSGFDFLPQVIVDLPE